ncbi:hypothetical protein G5C51_11180 [Streptomyces sp. A7024]|uniref:Uncharacterized protein n=1 Tax=Streptomyces coryli TaxID=1128680 RepID=A0A6G4TXC2_9ACTN|nr:hypothetical protein [Streptomyces coryli]NGN64463.1 hypothetical protein [Streptomyces coryli]
MSVAVCSLLWDKARNGAQKIDYDDDGYHLVRFPFDAETESLDAWDMHDPSHGGGSNYPDARSGLIWPSHDGWGYVSALIFWDPTNDASEYRLRFVRDPLNLATGYDSTATTDFTRTGGGQFRSHTWQMQVHKGVPLGLKISARGAGDAKIPVPIKHAQFKLSIQTDVITP